MSTGLKRMAVWLCILLIVVTLLSAALTALHSGHCCHPQACEICYQISFVRKLFGKFLPLFAALPLWLMGWTSSRRGLARSAQSIQPLTPVALSVRMNN